MSTVAETLRDAREAKKMTVQQVAEITKIRGDHIRALEEGNFDVFSAPVYIRGFVRTYAGLLKLDVPQTLSLLDTELSKTEKFREPPPLTDEPNTILDVLMYQLSKLDLRKSVMAGGGVLALIIVFSLVVSSRHRRNADPAVGLKPAVYQRTNAGETLPLPSAPNAHH